MTELEKTLSAVRSEQPIGYGRRVLPCVLDNRVHLFVEAYSKASPGERILVGGGNDETLRQVLLVFAERMASLAVRSVAKNYLLDALVALDAAGWLAEVRDNLMVLSLINDAATRIGLIPGELFAEIIPFISTESANSFQTFLKRSAMDKSIEAMGYQATWNDEGFIYERTW